MTHFTRHCGLCALVVLVLLSALTLSVGATTEATPQVISPVQSTSSDQTPGNLRSDIGLLIQLQPYIEAPAKEVLVDVVAFSNEPAQIPVIFQELQLYVGDAPTPIKSVRLNQVLKSLHHSQMPTAVIRDLVFPHPLHSRRMGISQEQFYQQFGGQLFVQTFSLQLTEIAPKLNYNDSLIIRAEGTFVHGGKPQVFTATSEATYMAPLVIPAEPGTIRLMADSYNGWYRTDAHIHSDWSDGKMTITQAAQAGYNAGLSTIVITDHGDQFDPKSSNYKNKGSWADQRTYIQSNTFALPITNGQEVTEDPQFTTSSHYLAYGLKSWVYNDINYNYGGGDLYNTNEQPLVDAVNNNNPPYSMGGPAHPGLDVYPWNGMEETGMTFMEVFDAIGGLDGESMNMWDQWHAAHLNDILYSNMPFIAATANSDGHNSTDVGKYSTYFSAPNGVTSPENFFTALRARKVVASQTPSYGNWTLNGSAMGSVIDVYNGQNLVFNFTHVPRGYNYNYVSRVLIILNDGTNNPRNINVYPSETATTSTYTIKPGTTLYPTKNGYYRVSIEFRHKSSSWGLSSYSWTICQPVFFRFHN